MQTFPIGCKITGMSPFKAPFTCTGANVVGGTVVVDARRFTGDTVVAALGAFIAVGTKLALRAQPVSVRSACLKFRTYSWRAFAPTSSTRSCIRWTGFLGGCSLHQIAAVIVPLSPPMLTMLCWSRREPLTGVISNPRVYPC